MSIKGSIGSPPSRRHCHVGAEDEEDYRKARMHRTVKYVTRILAVSAFADAAAQQVKKELLDNLKIR